MRKLTLLLILTLLTPAAFAQEEWRDRPYQASRRAGDRSFDITPFLGLRWGGTIYSDQTSLFGSDVRLNNSEHVGVNVGIPLNANGMKLELMVNRQETRVGYDDGIFFSDDLGDFNLTYYHAGILFPFNVSRSVIPFAVVSAGVTNLDPVTSGVRTSNRFSGSAGVGVKVPINSNISLRAEIRGFSTSMDDNDCSRCYYDDGSRDLVQGAANIGVGFRF